jgi:hypothetical protein
VTAAVSERGKSATPPVAPPADLEARIAAFESAGPPHDFDVASWLWMLMLGIAMPLILLAVGWWA